MLSQSIIDTIAYWTAYAWLTGYLVGLVAKMLQARVS